jgi:hypothetical protein
LVNNALQQDRRRLIKLHGDWEESTDRILTRTEYDMHYGTGLGDFGLPLPRLLKQVLVGRSILFVGCSLSQDRTVRVLARVVEESSEIGHFAILEQPQTASALQKKKRFVASHNIRPIWYPNGSHHTVDAILSTL